MVTDVNTKQLSSTVDLNKTKHIRIQQMYQGHPIWGADAVVHIPNGVNATLASMSANSSMNGIFYRDIANDIANTPAYALTAVQADKALQQATQLFQRATGIKSTIQRPDATLMVYVDAENKAHWVYRINFVVEPAGVMPKKPTYIMDATNFLVYQQWDDIKTLEEVSGGGFGGNEKMGELIYDGLSANLPALSIQRDAQSGTCYLQNSEVTVKDGEHSDRIAEFACKDGNTDHNNVFWSADFDKVNGAYSPSNDALFIGKVVKDMYQKWYGLPVLVSGGKPMMLNMRVHVKDWDGGPLENAYWDGSQMSFGDGRTMFYPLVSFGVGAHEVSHGFTEQHSNLVYQAQSGGLNESFSDMAAQAAEFYGYGHNTWQIGPEIFKQKDRALRYMDDPTRDCNGRKPGDRCSIAEVKDYKKSLNVHYSSGIFNKIFYLMGTAKDWDTKKAFDVMVQANMNYWTSNTTFAAAACGVLKATKDSKYDTDVVKDAIKEVGIKLGKCKA